MSIKKYEDVVSGRPQRLVRSKWANSRLGIIHQARLSLDHVLFLSLQHDSGINKGRIALTQREGTPEHARRRLAVKPQLASANEGGRVCKTIHYYDLLKERLEERSLIER